MCPVCGSGAFYRSGTRYPMGKLFGQLLSYRVYGCLDCGWRIRIHVPRKESVASSSMRSKAGCETVNTGLIMLRKGPGEAGLPKNPVIEPTMCGKSNSAVNGSARSSRAKVCTYTDNKARKCKVYLYELEGATAKGMTKEYNPINVSVPKGFALSQNYPKSLNQIGTIQIPRGRPGWEVRSVSAGWRVGATTPPEKKPVSVKGAPVE